MKISRIFLTKKLFTNFLSELEQNFVVLWQQHFNRLSKMRFICLEQLFHGDFFYLESYKQLVNLFRKSSTFFVTFRSKITYFFWKVSAWLSKLDSKTLEGFLGIRSFFGWINVFKNFSRHSADVFWTSKADYQNFVFICPYRLLQEKRFSWKNFQFDNIFQNGGRGGRESFFWVLWKKRNFGVKLSGGWSERDSTLPEGLFEERRVFPKNFQWIIFFKHSA